MSVRPNARTLRSSRAAVLSSLLPVYHSSAHFLPLSQSSLSGAVKPILAPLNSLQGNTPAPLPLGSLTRDQAYKASLAHEARNQQLTDLASISKTSRENSVLTTFNTDHTLHQSWQAAQRTGKEHELVQRVRRAVDALHGTVAGGQAGLHTLAELGLQAVEDAQLRLAEREAEAEHRRRQEARDAKLEAHYAEEEHAR